MAAGDGLVSMTPTSIAAGVGTASINADGGVDFTAVTELSLNGVFTSDHDNYFCQVFYTVTINDVSFTFRLRVGGSDNSTASSYTSQSLNAFSTTRSGGRSSGTSGQIGVSGTSQGNARAMHFYGPALAQPTAVRFVSVSGESVGIGENAVTHNQSTAYDGFTLFLGSGTMTGNIHVFGSEE